MEKFLTTALVEVNINRRQLLKKIRVYRPVIYSCVFVAVFILSVAFFGQPSEAQAVASDPSGYEKFTSLIGLITQIAIAVMFLVALVYFVWRGKSNEQLKEMVAGWKDAAERRGLKIAELEAELVKQIARTTRLEEQRKDDRKRILRLTARLADEDLDELDISDDGH